MHFSTHIWHNQEYFYIYLGTHMINRRSFLRSAMACSTASLLAPPAWSQPSSDRKPNIVMFYVDDLGWRDLGFMGSDFYETPNIDRLASEGMVFTNAYACAPNCAPSRACLMTGQYSPRHGIYTVGSSERGKSEKRKLIPTPNQTVLSADKLTIAKMLKESGYKTCHAGKWHLGSGENSGPKMMGFDVNIGGHQSGAPRSYFSPYHNPYLTDGAEGEHLTDRITSDSIEFIKQNKDKPFFLDLSFYAVHTPLQAKEELIDKYEKKPKGERHNHTTYAAMVENTDTHIGRVLATLDQLELRDNTVVMFYSDNGGYGPATTMEPLRGAKGMLYEGGIRVPLTVRFPGKVDAGSTCDTPVIGVDIFPTIKELSHSRSDENHVLDGESIVPLLTESGSLTREHIYWHFPAYLEAYKRTTGPWRTTPAGAIRNGDYKLIEFFENNRIELYNLKNDLSESKNLAESNPDIASRLHQQLKQWRSDVNAPVPTTLNPEYKAG